MFVIQLTGVSSFCGFLTQTQSPNRRKEYGQCYMHNSSRILALHIFSLGPTKAADRPIIGIVNFFGFAMCCSKFSGWRLQDSLFVRRRRRRRFFRSWNIIFVEMFGFTILWFLYDTIHVSCCCCCCYCCVVCPVPETGVRMFGRASPWLAQHGSAALKHSYRPRGVPLP